MIEIPTWQLTDTWAAGIEYGHHRLDAIRAFLFGIVDFYGAVVLDSV